MDPEADLPNRRYGWEADVRQSMIRDAMRRSIVIIGTSALLIGSAVPFGTTAPAPNIPIYEGVEDPEIAGVAALRNIEMLKAALNGTWRDRPVGFIVATTEGWAWTTPGLLCQQEGFVRAIMDGDSVVVNRTMFDAVEQHNEWLASEGNLGAEVRCKLTRSTY